MKAMRVSRPLITAGAALALWSPAAAQGWVELHRLYASHGAWWALSDELPDHRFVR